jgi:hypothetical protein
MLANGEMTGVPFRKKMKNVHKYCTVECALNFCLSQNPGKSSFICLYFFSKSSNGFYEVAVIPEISNGLLTDAYRDSRLVSNGE